jgi:hypothetical protein
MKPMDIVNFVYMPIVDGLFRYFRHKRQGRVYRKVCDLVGPPVCRAVPNDIQGADIGPVFDRHIVDDCVRDRGL